SATLSVTAALIPILVPFVLVLIALGAMLLWQRRRATRPSVTSARCSVILWRVARDVLRPTVLDELRRKLRAGNLAEERLNPGKEVVLRAGDRKLTRDELRIEAETVAGGLQACGVKAGDRVAIYAANSLEWVKAYLGVLRAGASAVMMNPEYHSAEAEHILRDSDPLLAIADAPPAVTFNN